MNTTFNSYIATGIFICAWFAYAAYSGWRIPNIESFSGGSNSYFYGGGGSSYGRSTGGSWGGGK